MKERLANGPAAAAILAAGIGCFAFGLATLVEHTVGPGRQALTLYPAVGSHSGTTAIAVLVWVATWGALHSRWRALEVDFPRVFLGALLLITLGMLGTFPPFYQAVGTAVAAVLSVS